MIAAGTQVMIELTQKVSSKTATSGDRFTIKLAGDLMAGDVVVAPAGATGVGEVVDAAPGGMAGRPGKLVLAARSVDFGATHLPLRSFHLAGAGHDSSKTVGLVTATPYVGILAVVIQGGNIDYPIGTRAMAKVAADTLVTPDRKSLSPIPTPQPPVSPAPENKVP